MIPRPPAWYASRGSSVAWGRWCRWNKIVKAHHAQQKEVAAMAEVLNRIAARAAESLPREEEEDDGRVC